MYFGTSSTYQLSQPEPSSSSVKRIGPSSEELRIPNTSPDQYQGVLERAGQEVPRKAAYGDWTSDGQDTRSGCR